MSVLHSPARTPYVPDPPRRRLRVVPNRAEPPARAPFVVLVVVMLGAGLIGLLLLNTALQQNSFAIHNLSLQTSRLEERQGELEQRVARLKAPQNLARRAEELGMVPNTNPVFLRLSDGAVLGDPVPAKPRPTPTPTPDPRQARTPTEPGGTPAPGTSPGREDPVAGDADAGTPTDQVGDGLTDAPPGAPR